jgi:hypothetical protein
VLSSFWIAAAISDNDILARRRKMACNALRDGSSGGGNTAAMDQPFTKERTRADLGDDAGEERATEEETRTMNGLATQPPRSEGAQPVVAAVHEGTAEASLEPRPCRDFLGAWTRAVEGRAFDSGRLSPHGVGGFLWTEAARQASLGRGGVSPDVPSEGEKREAITAPAPPDKSMRSSPCLCCARQSPAPVSVAVCVHRRATP